MSYTANKPLKPNVGVGVIERDEQGAIVGAYTGYWNFGRHTVALYPDMRHPFVRWRGTPRKKVINDSLIRVNAETKSEVKAPGVIKSQTSRLRKLPLDGQEKMKL